LSVVKRGRFESLKKICHCTSVFAFGFFGDVKTDSPPNFACCWHHKKDIMVYDTNCDTCKMNVPQSWHKMTNENIIMKKIFLFFLWYKLSYMQIELVIEWIKNDR
jgi:hypothetical protein